MTLRWLSWRSVSARAARRRLGRSLSIREVDAGLATAELEIHALSNAFYDLERWSALRGFTPPR
jgi:Ni,Fe-hydrogenase III small subunit